MGTRRCGYCGEDGHYRSTCPRRLADVVDDHDGRISRLEKRFARLKLISGLVGVVLTLLLKVSGQAPVLESLSIFNIVPLSFAVGFLACYSLKLVAGILGPG